MRRLKLHYVLGGLLVGLVAATQSPLRAQREGKPPADPAGREPTIVSGPTKVFAPGSIQDALIRPFDFSFAAPVSLSEVAKRLSQELSAPVVLDLAALERLDIKPEDSVKLELRGVRLKTGLKLLLDQVGLTYRSVPEDNLLILTDKEGSEDPIERVMAELHELHKDVHEIQDALDEMRELTGLQAGDGARVRKPTIIEEMPEGHEPKPLDHDLKPHDEGTEIGKGIG